MLLDAAAAAACLLLLLAAVAVVVAGQHLKVLLGAGGVTSTSLIYVFQVFSHSRFIGICHSLRQ